MAIGMLFTILLLLIVFLAFKISMIKKSAREIKKELSEILKENTNRQICISSRDKDMRSLAAALNDQLKTLRLEQLQYKQGNSQLKEAVTNISHDLRTPLTAICGYLDLLEREQYSETAAHYLKIIRGRTELMKQLTEEFFNYSVLTSSTEIPMEDVDLNAALEESISAFYAVLKKSGITPDIMIPEKKVIRRLNKKTLFRIFENILSNALKYSDGDLQIELKETGEILFSNHTSKLGEIEAGRLFNRYFTVENAEQSTGLGLSIAKELIEKMGGAIMAECCDGVLKIKIQTGG